MLRTWYVFRNEWRRLHTPTPSRLGCAPQWKVKRVPYQQYSQIFQGRQSLEHAGRNRGETVCYNVSAEAHASKHRIAEGERLLLRVEGATRNAYFMKDIYCASVQLRAEDKRLPAGLSAFNMAG